MPIDKGGVPVDKWGVPIDRPFLLMNIIILDWFGTLQRLFRFRSKRPMITPNTLKLKPPSKIPQLTPEEFRKRDAHLTKNQIIDAKHSPSIVGHENFLPL